MSKELGVNPEAARKIQSDGSEFKLPAASRDELRSMTREEWMEKYGEVLASEEHFERKDPNWAQNQASWWYKEVGRAGAEPPLWMQSQWHIPELDCPPNSDRIATTVDQRSAKPLWAERMNLSGSKQGDQSTTIYGHRQEYLPSHKPNARSMYERYQPSYQRIVNEEIPDTADPPDGRFWKAGVAQGVSTNPYEKRLAISGRRKPIVVGPRSISVVVDGEGHTLANPVRDVAWLHPSVEFAGYSLEHPVYRHANLRVQTVPGAAAGAEQALAETLEMTQDLFKAVGKAMKKDFNDEWESRKIRLEEEEVKFGERKKALAKERAEKMALWVQMTEKTVPWDRNLEIELFGKVITKELDTAATGKK
jgi:DNA-directed RNA polymerase subunit L